MRSLHDLRILRNQYKISVLELAAHSGLTETYINQLEDEAIKPLDTDLARIEKALMRLHKSQNEHVTGEIDEP